MLACRALYFLLALVTVGVLAIDENTRIANRTIERVRLFCLFCLNFGCGGSVEYNLKDGLRGRV